MRGHRTIANLIAVLCTLLTVGCGHTFYAWGHYEQSILRMYQRSDKFSVSKEIEILSKDVERAVRRGQFVPPGMMAHLGYLYYLAGEYDLAAKHLNREKELFPESAVFVDTLLAGLP